MDCWWDLSRLKILVECSLLNACECVDFVSSTGFRGSFSFSCLLTLDLDNFRFIQMDFVADGGFLLIIHIGFRKFWWISWISIFRPTTLSQPLSAIYQPAMGAYKCAFCPRTILWFSGILSQHGCDDGVDKYWSDCCSRRSSLQIKYFNTAAWRLRSGIKQSSKDSSQGQNSQRRDSISVQRLYIPCRSDHFLHHLSLFHKTTIT